MGLRFRLFISLDSTSAPKIKRVGDNRSLSLSPLSGMQEAMSRPIDNHRVLIVRYDSQIHINE